MQNIIDMLMYLKGDSFIEINDLRNTLRMKDALGKRNMYFVGGLGEKKDKRCNDDDIKTKKYFVVDLDIRLLHYKNTGNVLSQDELQLEFTKIIDILNNNGFGDYSYACDSGNGLHLYYCGTERVFDKELYSNGVHYIYEQIDAVLNDLGYSCDVACTNLARIMRLPGTLNLRRKEIKKQLLWDLGDIECIILEEKQQISFLFDGIEEFAEQYKQEQIQHKKDQVQIKEIVKQDYKKSDDVRKQINEIPACNIACDIRGVTLSDRGLDNVALKEDKKNMGAYRYKPHNVIVNTGSSMIKTNKSYFTSYELVYYELMDQDKSRTIQYFKERYGIELSNKPNKLEIPKHEFVRQGYLYGNNVFDAFDCAMSGELITVVAETNVGKTSFAMDMMQSNINKGKKCFYINLEFAIETVWQSRWLFLNGKRKRNLTDLDPLSEDEKYQMDKYVKDKLGQFKYHNAPNGISLEELVQLIMGLNKEGYGLFVIDTFSRITGNLDSAVAHSSQNKSMEVLQELCQNLGIVIVNLHHTNKKGEFEGSKKIMDLSNVFIMMSRDEDGDGNRITKYELTKDKFINKIELETYYVNQQPSLTPPPKAF